MWVQVPPAVLYNIIMKIIVDPHGHGYMGKLYIDDELIDAHSDNRPGCCVRALMNTLLFKYGGPDSTITVTIDGW